MAKENRVLTIDIGGDNLKMAEFFFPEGTGEMVLTNFLFRKIEKKEDEGNREMFFRYYTEMLQEGGFSADSVRLSLSAQNSFQRLSKLPPMLGSRTSVDRLVEYEAAQSVPYSMDEVEWDYQLLHHQWDENVEEEQPDGTKQMVSVRKEEYESLFIAMKSEDVVCYTDVIEDSGKKLLSVEIAPVALFNAAVAAQISQDECVLLLNIGGRASSLMISDHQRLFMRNIPIGGDAITTQIAREFNVSPAEAEDFKRRYGFVALGGAYDEPESELAATISKIARNVMTRLHGEVSRSVSVWRAQHGGAAPTRVLLCGGGSTMLYTTDFFQEKLRMPTEYLNTFGLLTISDQVSKDQLQAVAPMFQVLTGLALRNRGRCPVDISLLPRAIKKQMALDARKPYFFASAAALLCCLLIFIVGIAKLNAYEGERATKVEEDVKRATKEFQRVKKLDGELNTYRTQHQGSLQYLQDRNKWAAVINELEEMLPDTMWLVALEYQGDKMVHATAKNEMEGMMGLPAEENIGIDTALAENPNKQQTVEEIANLKEIQKVRLVGYALDPPDHLGDSLALFQKRLKDSRYFQSEEPVISRMEGKYFLTYLEFVLPLKEPLRK